jgi:hypothetical protein
MYAKKEGRMVEKRYVGTAEGGEAQVSMWRNMDGDLVLMIDEECWEEGRPGTLTVSAVACLPKDAAAQLARDILAQME